MKPPTTLVGSWKLRVSTDVREPYRLANPSTATATRMDSSLMDLRVVFDRMHVAA
jgi:hypothetical protein